jgi:hypothetical protein
MSLLEYRNRPLTAFDPSNKDHRRWYRNFLKHGVWGRCPYRFIVPEDFGGDLISMIQRSLVEFYTKLEFDHTSQSHHEQN